jgi:phosphatidylserine/phosphatidylglycerophosphate/cardiolipin synthase-like enzyme
LAIIELQRQVVELLINVHDGKVIGSGLLIHLFASGESLDCREKARRWRACGGRWEGNKGKASIAALNLLVNAGIPTRTISTYAIHHDKYIVADERHVQNGSFNYSQAASKANSENVLVVWHNPELAASFLRHWNNRFEQGVGYQSTYWT